MLIYVCCSSHGFGHAARDAAVLQQLRRLRPDWRLVMSSQVSPGFLSLLLGDREIEQRPCRWDVGMVQADALGSDPSATLIALAELDARLPGQIQSEARWIRKQGLPVLILGDIPPAAAQLARAVDAPLVWMSNFGWDEIYRPFGGAFELVAERALESYRCGQLLLRCPFHLAMDWGLSEQRLDLVCSNPRALPTVLQQMLEDLDQPIIQVGFGGIGLDLDPQLFAHWPNCHFLMACPPNPEASARLAGIANLTLLPDGVRPLDVFPFCERHIGKPGFSTFCEALSLELGLHVVERQDFAEVSALMQGLVRHGRHRQLTRQQLICGDWQLDQPLLQAEAEPLAAGGALQAAEQLIRIGGPLCN